MGTTFKAPLTGRQLLGHVFPYFVSLPSVGLDFICLLQAIAGGHGINLNCVRLVYYKLYCSMSRSYRFDTDWCIYSHVHVALNIETLNGHPECCVKAEAEAIKIFITTCIGAGCKDV